MRSLIVSASNDLLVKVVVEKTGKGGAMEQNVGNWVCWVRCPKGREWGRVLGRSLGSWERKTGAFWDLKIASKQCKMTAIVN